LTVYIPADNLTVYISVDLYYFDFGTFADNLTMYIPADNLTVYIPADLYYFGLCE
jgi:hypothetical protein